MIRRLFSVAAIATCVAVGSTTTANAGVIVLSFPEVNMEEVPEPPVFPGPLTEVGTKTFNIPGGEWISSVTFSGTFSQTSTHPSGGLSGTAHHRLFINGIEVADTDGFPGNPYGNIVPFSLTFTSGQLLDSLLSSGSATLEYIQDGPNRVRLSATTLTITTAPEPGTMALMALGSVGLFGSAIRRQRAQKTTAA